MAYRAKNPVTILCEQCGESKDLKGQNPKVRDGNFCSARCSAAWHRERDALTTWRLMELTRLLWKSRPEGFEFRPRPFPGNREWREQLNGSGDWLRGLVEEHASMGGQPAGNA